MHAIKFFFVPLQGCGSGSCNFGWIRVQNPYNIYSHQICAIFNIRAFCTTIMINEYCERKFNRREFYMPSRSGFPFFEGILNSNYIVGGGARGIKRKIKRKVPVFSP